MPRPFFLIDGYNLMHAAGLARGRYGPGDLEKQRNRFLRYLADGLKPAERERATVVFDAGGGDAVAEHETDFEDMKLVYASPDSDADTLIEHLLAKHSAPKQVVVVSDDRRLQRAARRRKSTFQGSGKFWFNMNRRREREEQQTPPETSAELDSKFNESDTEQDVSEWMQVFDGVDTNAMRDESIASGDNGEDSITDNIEDADFWQRRIEELEEET